MKELAKQIYRNIMPPSLRRSIGEIRDAHYLKILMKRIISYYSNLSEFEITAEQSEVLEYLKKNQLHVFPYSYISEYNPKNVEVFTDNKLGLSYVLLDGKRLYFKRSWTPNKIKESYNSLQIEQDINSPHLYLTNDFTIENNDVIVDVGVAEGNFSLGVVEKAKKIYLFETDGEWIEALEATFAPWKEKVEIINKFVSNKNDDKNITLDSFLKNRGSINFLKIDVDGAEAELLKGSEEVLNDQKPLKIALCTYHKQNDEKEFTILLNHKGFDVSYSKRYMIFYADKITMGAPFLRRGLIRATKTVPTFSKKII